MGSWALAPHASRRPGRTPPLRSPSDSGSTRTTYRSTSAPCSLGLVPLGLLLIPAALTYAGGRQVARVAHPRLARRRDQGGHPLRPGLRSAGGDRGRCRCALRWCSPIPRTAFLAGTAIAAVGAGLGLLRASDLLPELVRSVPGGLRDLAAAAAAGLATVVLMSGVLTTLILGVGFPDVAETFRALDAGWAGGPVLVLLTVAFVPNLILWTAAFTIGVGFPIGADGAGVSPERRVRRAPGVSSARGAASAGRPGTVGVRRSGRPAARWLCGGRGAAPTAAGPLGGTGRCPRRGRRSPESDWLWASCAGSAPVRSAARR